ncbi:MAG: ATPase, T2SS/T4P/T4SS family, partial [Patescibacteria group bacterium]
MTDQDLLQEIQKAGLLDQTVSEKVKKDALLSGKSIEAILIADRLVDDVRIAEIKSKILRVPYKKVDSESIIEELLVLVPEEIARTYEAIPMAKKENLLIVGMLHPDSQKAQEALRFIARKERLNLGVYLISFSDWKDALRKYSPYRNELERAVHQLDIKSGKSGQKIIHLEEGGEGEEAPIIKIVADTFKEALASRASDIHIEPMEHYLRIRFRIDGDLREVASLPIELSQPVISRIKVISGLKIDEARIPQGGRFRTRVSD